MDARQWRLDQSGDHLRNMSEEEIRNWLERVADHLLRLEQERRIMEEQIAMQRGAAAILQEMLRLIQEKKS
jgi:hypothetical protein